MAAFGAIFKTKYTGMTVIVNYSQPIVIMLMLIIPALSCAQKQKYHELYSWGMYFPPPITYNHKCKENIDLKYGFKVKWVAGCVVKKRDVRKWNLHNWMVNWKLNLRNGKDWKYIYSEEIKQCKIELENSSEE